MKNKAMYGLSVPEIEPIVNGEVCGTGCGSTEYIYNTRAMRDRDAKKIAKQLRKIAKELERGEYNCDFDDDPEEGGSLSPAGYMS